MRYTIRVAAAILACCLAPLSATSVRAVKPVAASAAPHTIKLTEAQKKKLVALQSKARSEVTAVQKGKGTEAAKRQKLIAIIKKYDALEMNILTAGQRKTVLAARAEQKKVQDRTAAVAKTLTPAQKKKIEGYQAAFVQQAKALDADKKMTQQQKQAKFTAMRNHTEKQIDSVLTAKQRAMLKGK